LGPDLPSGFSMGKRDRRVATRQSRQYPPGRRRPTRVYHPLTPISAKSLNVLLPLAYVLRLLAYDLWPLLLPRAHSFDVACPPYPPRGLRPSRKTSGHHPEGQLMSRAQRRPRAPASSYNPSHCSVLFTFVQNVRLRDGWDFGFPRPAAELS